MRTATSPTTVTGAGATPTIPDGSSNHLVHQGRCALVQLADDVEHHLPHLLACRSSAQRPLLHPFEDAGDLLGEERFRPHVQADQVRLSRRQSERRLLC
jgi:hypothetical protein